MESQEGAQLDRRVKRQVATVILSILNFKHGFRLCSAGEPGYLDFDNLPETNFSCQGKVIGGYYADIEAGCQMFHVCTIGQKDEIMDIKFLCLNGTVFDQETRVCERVDEVDCSKSERFYNLNLELYGNNAVTLSLHEEDDDDSTESRDDHQQQQQTQHQQQQHLMTSTRPSTTSSTSTTTSRPSQPSTTLASNVFQKHPTGYPQHYQPRPAFSSIQTSQSNTHYNDKNGGYHHQYIFHTDERNNNNQATSYQVFSNQGVSSTMPTPPVHQQIRYSSSPQLIHSKPVTVMPIQYHVQSTSSTIETLLNNNANNPSLINPLFHNHGIISTTEQYNIHNNNPHEIAEYQDNSDNDENEHNNRRALEPVQSSNKGKVSKLTISPVPQEDDHSSIIQNKSGQTSRQQRISINYQPTPSPIPTTISDFYLTQNPTSQKPHNSQNNQQIPQHIHILPLPSIPQLNPHQVTINLPPPDIQRIVQNPSPLLPSQSRVIVTAKASVSDESGRPLNASQLITLPLPTIPSNYDDYKEGDESFDPFYRDVPKIRNDRKIILSSEHNANKRHLRKKRATNYNKSDESYPSGEVIFNAEIKDIKDLNANLPIIKAILFGLPIPKIEEPSKIEVTNIDNTHNNGLNKTLIFNNATLKEFIDDKNISTMEKITSKGMEYLLLQTEEKNENMHLNLNISNDKKNEKMKSNINDEFETIAKKIKNKQIYSTLRTNIEDEIFINPLNIKHNDINLETEASFPLFSQLNERNNSQLVNYNSSTSIELLNPLNKRTDINIITSKILPEVLKKQSSVNKSNRRKHLNNKSSEEFDEHLTRRNSYTNRPKSNRYNEKYDIDERIELNLRPRAHRFKQRPKDRRIPNYEYDYLYEEDNEYNEYFEDNVNKNNKNRSRMRSQGGRESYGDRNRHFYYEDELEKYDKLKLISKTSNSTSQITENSHYERPYESRKRRPDIEMTKHLRRPSLVSNAQIRIKKFNLKLKQVDFPMTLHQESMKYFLNDKQNENNHTMVKMYSNSSRRDKESTEEQKDKINDDYTNKKELYLDEYNDSEEANIPDDYVDYTNFTDTINESIIENRRNRNRNRFGNEFEEIPQRKLDRQNKSIKFIEENGTYQGKIDNKYIELTSPRHEPKDKMTNSVIANKVYSESNIFKEYDDYDEIKITSTTENLDNAELFEQVKTSTEGIFKFTDELPLIEKNEESQKNYKQKYEISTNEEDYVDDNYEPESYIYSINHESLPSIQKFDKEYNKDVFTINDQPKNIKIYNRNETLNNSGIRSWDNKNDEIYEDNVENTTISLSSDKYYDLEITTNNFYSITSNPISTSIRDSTISLTNKPTINTQFPIMTNASIPIAMVTTTSTPAPVTIPIITSNTTTLTTINYALTTLITSMLTPTIATSVTSTHNPTRIDIMPHLDSSTLATSKTATTTRSPILAIITKSTTKKAKVTTKFFKPITFRKNYTYIPPSTTPNSVIIRRGHPLSSPKPTKPLLTYNDLAPKPIIRRLPLLSRTTSTSEPRILEEEIVELPTYTLEQRDWRNVNENKMSVHSNKNISSVSEVIKNNSISSLLPSTQTEKHKIVNKDFDFKIMNFNNETFSSKNSSLFTNPNKTIFKDSSFNTKIPKQNPAINYSNNIVKMVKDLVTESSKSKSSLTNYNQNILKLEVTTKTDSINNNNNQPSERHKLDLTSVKSQIQKGNSSPKSAAGFNCLEKEMYRFYGDVRDCRLFHYCSPGFTVRQVLDFRFVCEEGTIFHEESQSCRHDVPNAKCVKRTW